ncbi:MAG: hypothetical protein ACOY0T_28445 [Myxococcota bacterium]
MDLGAECRNDSQAIAIALELQVNRLDAARVNSDMCAKQRADNDGSLFMRTDFEEPVLGIRSYA